ncbi:DUF3696 domain-containing protein [Aeromonas veronii]
MINFLQVNKFKSLDLNAPILLKPLNVFCGANSSGKSSLLQSILLLAQTANTKYSGSSMSLNGRLVKLGGFNDIISFGMENDLISLGVEITNSESESEINSVFLKINFGFGGEVKEVQREQITPPIKSINYIIHTKNDSEPLKINLEATETDGLFKVNKIHNQNLIYSGWQNHDLEIQYLDLDGIKPEKCHYSYNESKRSLFETVDFLFNIRKHRRYYKDDAINNNIVSSNGNQDIPVFLIDIIIEIINREKDTLRKNLTKTFLDSVHKFALPMGVSEQQVLDIIIKNQMITDVDSMQLLKQDRLDRYTWSSYIRSLRREQQRNILNIISRNKDEIIAKSLKLSEPNYKTDIHIPNLFHSLAKFINENLAIGTKYIGPIRSKPKSVYPLSDIINNKDLGTKGENSAAILHINKNLIIKYPAVKTSSNDGITITSKTASFSEAVHDWLRYLDVVQNVSTKDQGKFGYELKVKTNSSKSPQDLNHVGVGVSQVIPIVLQCLLSEENDILIFEQPELHLHPKIQAKLCDLFIAISEHQRQVIIETHSEYMINRLRYRIAQDLDNKLSSNVAINFATKKDDQTTFEGIQITNYGAIKNWPKDFFDQSQLEVEGILFSANKKRKLEKRGDN